MFSWRLTYKRFDTAVDVFMLFEAWRSGKGFATLWTSVSTSPNMLGTNMPLKVAGVRENLLGNEYWLTKKLDCGRSQLLQASFKIQTLELFEEYLRLKTSLMGVNGSCACRIGPQFPRISQVFGGSVNPFAATAADAFDPAIRNCAFEVRDFTENETKCGCLKPLSITAIEILYSHNWVRDGEKPRTWHSPSTQGLAASYECQLNIKFSLLQQTYLKTRKSSCKRPKLWESDKKQCRAPHPVQITDTASPVLGSDGDALEMR